MPTRTLSETAELVRVIADFGKQVADLSKNVGELSGQVREQIHISNNTQAMVQALSENQRKMDEKNDRRFRELEKKDDRREGATGVLQTILKSPLIGWVVGAAISAWAILTGKVHV